MLSKKVREIFPHIILILVSLILGMLIFNLVYSKTPLDTKVVLNRKAVVEGFLDLNVTTEELEAQRREVFQQLPEYINERSALVTNYENSRNQIIEKMNSYNSDDYVFTPTEAEVTANTDNDAIGASGV